MEKHSQYSRSSAQLASISRNTAPMPKGSLAMEKETITATSVNIPK